MDVIRFKTPKGKAAFCVDVFSFRQDKRAADGERWYWRCLEPQCSVRMETVGLDGVPQARGNQDHSHGLMKDDAVHRRAVTQMKETAATGTMPIPQIYEHVAVDLHQTQPGVAATLPVLNSCNSSLYRARRKELPKLPGVLADLGKIPQVFAFTGENHDDPFVISNTLLQGGEEGSILMASETCLRLLSTRTSWFMDGTFKVAPRLFKQLFTVHVMPEGKVIPCAYALMASKSKRSYQRVFRELKDYVENMHLPELHPVSIMTDFEQAMLNAIDDEFPLAQSRGCLFHYTQCIWRKIQYLGLQPQYNEGGDLQDVCRQIMALPFLPVDDIPLAFAWVEELSQDLSPAMIELIGYVDRQWVCHRSVVEN